MSGDVLEPFKRGRLDIKNRVVVTAHTYGLLDSTSRGEESMLAYIRARLAGGVGMLVMGETRFGDRTQKDAWGAAGSSDAIIGFYERAAAVGLEFGGLVVEQLFHPGGQVWHEEDSLGLAPSCIPHARSSSIPHSASARDVINLVGQVRVSAARVREGQLNGVELKCDQGKLHHQFLSRYFNRRSDQYGGSLEKRASFLVASLEAIRESLRSDQIVGVRLPGACVGVDGNPSDLTEQECLEICKIVERSDLADYVSFSGESNSTAWGYQANHPNSMTDGDGLAAVARRIRDQMDLPVVFAGGIRTLNEAAARLADGTCDLVGMARAHIAEPSLVRKSLEESGGQSVRHCISCNQGCIGSTWYGNPVRCSVNPASGREASIELRRARVGVAVRRKFVVVGAGPAGLEFTLEAVERGHEVELIDRSSTIGGRLAEIALLPGKQTFTRYRTYLINRIRSSVSLGNVKLKLNTDLDLASFEGSGDALVLACGAEYVVPQHLSSPLVVTVDSLLRSFGLVTGKKILVVDSERHSDALGIALELIRNGADVSVWTPFDAVGLGLDPVTLTSRLARLRQNGVECRTWFDLVSIEGHEAIFRDQLQHTFVAAACDLVVYVGNPLPRFSISDLRAWDGPAIAIGDGVLPRGLLEATASGFDAVYDLEETLSGVCVEQ